MDQQKSKIIKLSFKDGTTFLSESWLQCQFFCKENDKKPDSLSILYDGKEFCYWPNSKNYILFKKAICFPGHPVVECLYVGFLSFNMLFLTMFSNQMQILKSEQKVLSKKDRGFLLW